MTNFWRKFLSLWEKVLFTKNDYFGKDCFLTDEDFLGLAAKKWRRFICQSFSLWQIFQLGGYKSFDFCDSFTLAVRFCGSDNVYLFVYLIAARHNTEKTFPIIYLACSAEFLFLSSMSLFLILSSKIYWSFSCNSFFPLLRIEESNTIDSVLVSVSFSSD